MVIMVPIVHACTCIFRTVEILESVEDLSFTHPALHALRWLQAYFYCPTEKHIEMPKICFLGTGTDNKGNKHGNNYR